MKFINSLKNQKLKSTEYFLLSLLTIFLIFPMKYAKYILVGIFFVWVIVVYLNDKKGFLEFFIKPHFVSYFVYVWVIFNAYIILFTKIVPFSINFLAIAFTLLLYLYYSKKKEKTGIIIISITALITILLVNITTTIAVTLDHDISRLLSTTMKNDLNYFGIGNYSFVYGLVFVSLALLMAIFNLNKNWKYKLVILFVLLLSVICIYKTAFLIALILLIFGIILVVLKVNTIEKLASYTGLCLIILFILIYSGLALRFFTYLAENTNNHYFQSRFNDIALVLKKEDLSKTDDIKIRFSVYKYSLDAFLDSPIVGMLNENYLETNKQAGGHSAVLDEFARYGLVFSTPFFAMMLFVISEIRKTFDNVEYKKCWFIITLCAIILGLINTMIFPTLIFMLFTVVPSILKCCELYEAKESETL